MILLVCGIEPAPRPPQAPSIEARLAAHDLAIAELRADLAAYKAHYGSAPKSATQPVGYVAVTKATEVHHPGLLNVAGEVATAPLKAVTRTVCGTNSCRQVTEWVPDTSTDSVQAAPMVQGDCSSGNCANGQCGMQTQRRGFFGRRRGW